MLDSNYSRRARPEKGLNVRGETELELHDIQGLVVYGFAERKWTQYILLRINYEQRAKAKEWLRSQLGSVEAPPDNEPPDKEGDGIFPAVRIRDRGRKGVRVALAFTYLGLKALGLPETALDSFVPEFRQGMTSAHRARAFGDEGKNDSKKWRWGQWSDEITGDDRQDADRSKRQVHVLCAAYALNEQQLRDWSGPRGVSARLWQSRGFELVDIVDAKLDEHEPFGFRDGISQPHIKGSGREIEKVPERDQIEPGEFILGYPNEFGQFSQSPCVAAADGVAAARDPAASCLPPTLDGKFRDLGRNGSFLVVRELEQDVARFHREVSERAAASAVGRWRDGTPLVLHPLPVDRTQAVGKKAPGPPTSLNEFTYFPEDAAGLRCPLGAHVRRSNPRDALADPLLGTSAADALRLANTHRLLRRSRMFASGDRKGLFFLCLNTNIERQFEFVQQTWINNPKFSGPHEERDPVLSPEPSEELTVAAGPERDRIQLASYVTVRGGAYFFLPGINALRYLTSL